MQTTTWRDRVMAHNNIVKAGETCAVVDDLEEPVYHVIDPDESDPALDTPFDIATDIDHVVYYIMSVLNATMWSLRGGQDVVVHRHDDGSRSTLTHRETLENLRVWLHQHAPAYHYERPDVANDMLSLATTLWDVLEAPTGGALYTEVQSLVEYLYM